MTSDLIRVALADDHLVLRAGIKALLADVRDIVIVGEASTGREAVTLVQRLQPDVMVMDLSMPDLDGTAATRQIVALGLGTRVLVLTMHTEDDYLASALEAGASGYLMKNDADRELVNAVRAVAHGGGYMRPGAARILARRVAAQDARRAERERYDRLTARERSVLQLIGQGYSAPEIGARLEISPKTVDTYKQRIQEKLDLVHRSDYVQFAFRLGLLTAE